MHKWIMSALVTIACAMGVYLLATGLPERPQEEKLAEGQQMLNIKATNFAFDKAEYRVEAGTSYRVKFANTLGVHGVEFKGLGIELDRDNPEIDVVFDTPGEYELICSIMCGQGHNDMVSVLIVE
ncbi:cytochrome C oxidase subunit II [Paenibacillaceae bacterium WGS1546]|uniref:cytochrome C oxidase subunit II n=1 Tax=Cohnella sp. WGS1546 TaxID=3366810 RepID=UPI00372CE8E0